MNIARAIPIFIALLMGCQSTQSTSMPHGSHLGDKPVIVRINADYDKPHFEWIVQSMAHLKRHPLSHMWPVDTPLRIEVHPTLKTFSRAVGKKHVQLRAYTTKEAIHLLTPTMWQGDSLDYPKRLKHEYVHWVMLNHVDKAILECAPGWFHEGIAIAFSEQIDPDAIPQDEKKETQVDVCEASRSWQNVQEVDYIFGGQQMNEVYLLSGSTHFAEQIQTFFSALSTHKGRCDRHIFETVFEEVFQRSPCLR